MGAITSSSSSTFGGLLDGLFDNVNDTIEAAVHDIEDMIVKAELQAGTEIAIEIGNAKAAYKEMLNYTIDKVSQQAKDTFDKLNSMVQDFQKRNSENLQRLEQEAQQLLLTLPLKYKPQLTAIKPRNLVIEKVVEGKEKSSLVVFKGVFPSVARSGCTPTYTLDGKKCTLIDSTNQSLTFEVPQAPFVDTNQRLYGYRTGDLKIPNEEGTIRSHIVDYTYKVGLGALPQQAGRGSVEYVAKQSERITEHKITEEKFYDGGNWYPEHWHTEYWRIYPSDGWQIDVTKDPQLKVTHVHGDHKQGIETISPTEIVVKVELYCNSGSDMGKVKLQVEYDQCEEKEIITERKEDFEMNWTDSKLLEPQGEEVISKVTFVDYESKTQEFGAPSLNNGVLKVSAEGNGKWRVWAEAPSELTLQASDMSKSLQAQVEAYRKIAHFRNITNFSQELGLPSDKKHLTTNHGKPADPNNNNK